MITLEDFSSAVLNGAEPQAQNTSEGNLGFGWLYYALVRNVRPAFVIAIGSRKGFMPFCAARAVQDNGFGKVLFIDPSYEGYGHPGWSGGGFWSDPDQVAERVDSYGLSGWIEHLRLTSEEAFPIIRTRIEAPQAGIVIIDGAHTHENSLQDFKLYSSLFNGGFALLHDSVAPETKVPRTIAELRGRGLSMITLDHAVGLTIVELRRHTPVNDAWGYLCGSSNRGEQIAARLHGMLRPGDRILEGYCGTSPTVEYLDNVELFGFDGDPAAIAHLAARFPQHTWRTIDERQLPFAELPADVDVLVGLGVAHGYAAWDPQQVLNNVRYLCGRYLPRVCLFETAADYHDADILRDLKSALVRLGYFCHYEWLNTDLAAFPLRKLLIALRDRQWPPHWIFPDLESAQQTVEDRLRANGDASWALTHTFVYRSADGHEQFRMLRLENTKGAKAFQPITPDVGEWRLGGGERALPLYRLPELTDADIVLVVEGEKAAEQAWALGLVATTSAYGSAAAYKTDWTPLAGRRVIVLPDNDEAGRAYANTVNSLLAELSPPAEATLVALPDLPPGGDVVEYVTLHHAEMSLEAIGHDILRRGGLVQAGSGQFDMDVISTPCETVSDS